LDARNWVVDFGGLKEVKAELQSFFDHKLLVAEDDPALDLLCSLGGMGLADVVVIPAVGCEAFAKFIFDRVNLWLLHQDDVHGRVRLASVEVREHGANSAIYGE
jgi:6-pyruvoyltetrahydropterin/6-carboxytetrahydropterin synthase